MKKALISIIELHYHAEVLQNLFEYLDYDSFDFQLITTAEVLSHLDVPERIEVHVVQKNVKEVHNELVGSDLLFFNTMAEYFGAFQPYLKQKPVIVRIHNVNTWFGPQGMAKPQNKYEAWKFVSHFIRKELLGRLSKKRQASIQHIDQFIFPADFMLQTATTLRPALESQFYKHIIPLTNQKPILQPNNKFKHIVIPGRVDQRKKDYGFALKVFEKLKKLGQRFELTILGNPAGKYGEEVIAQFESLHHSAINVKTYQEYIPPNAFWLKISQADILFLPLIKSTSFTMYREFYGQTKISGAVNDAMAYGKPFLLPKFYPIDKTVTQQATHYLNIEHATSLLENMLTKPTDFEENRKLKARDIKAMYSTLFASSLKR